MKLPMLTLPRLSLVLAPLSIGVVFGIASDSIPLGLMFGLAIGLCFLPAFSMTGEESVEKPAPVKSGAGDFDFDFE